MTPEEKFRSEVLAELRRMKRSPEFTLLAVMGALLTVVKFFDLFSKRGRL